jgi:hypothetical protein
VAVRLLGTVTAVVAGGVASLGVVGVVAARVPQLRRLTELRTTNHELTPSERS